MIKTTKYIPYSLRELRVWCLWRLEEDENGRKTKVPYSALYNGRASSANSKTWSTYEYTKSILEDHPSEYNGMSLAISKEHGLLFIDIDHCVDEEGQLSSIATDILGQCEDQFVELSQSGSGIHIIARGTIPRNFKNSKFGVEMYSDKRFCAMTGDAICPNEPCENQSVIDTIFERYKTSKSEINPVRSQNIVLNNSDNWVIEHAMNKEKFRDLYSGNWSFYYKSHSEGDLVLCTLLAFWCNCDVDQIDRIFRTSELYRPKWERSDYREATLSLAVNNCRETFAEYLERRRREDERAYLEMWGR